MSAKCTVEGCGKWSFQGGLCRGHMIVPQAASASAAMSPKQPASSPPSAQALPRAGAYGGADDDGRGDTSPPRPSPSMMLALISGRAVTGATPAPPCTAARANTVQQDERDELPRAVARQTLADGKGCNERERHPLSVSDARRAKPHRIDALVTQPAFFFGFQTGVKQLQAVFPSRFRFRFKRNSLGAMPFWLGPVKRLLLIAKGRLCTMLLQRLLCAPDRFAGDHFRLGRYVLSRIHAFDNSSSATCVATLEGHISSTVFSVAFHATAPLLATGSSDYTAKLWRLSSDFSSATCVATLQGHSSSVCSVAFHAILPLLATGSMDETAKLWRLSSDNSSATCVATLRAHTEKVNCVAFHATAPFLATGSSDMTAKLWRLSPDNSSAKCVVTLKDHDTTVDCVAFHATAPLFATASGSSVKLWQLSSENSSATCVATLEGHSGVLCVAFHPTAPVMATGSWDTTAKLWRLSSDNSSATCVATLQGHNHWVYSVAFHPTAPFLATGSGDNTAKLWRLSSDNSSATCVETLQGHSNSIMSVAFHATAPLLATASMDHTAKLWR